MASPCGIVLGMIELFGAESLSQVLNALLIYLTWASSLGIDLPLTGCYDDACHLLLFLIKRQHKSTEALLLSIMDWAIDNFHYDNHTCVHLCVCVLRAGERVAPSTTDSHAHNQTITGTSGAASTSTPSTASACAGQTRRRARASSRGC